MQTNPHHSPHISRQLFICKLPGRERPGIIRKRKFRLLLERIVASVKEGLSVVKACEEVAISEASYYRWRARAAGDRPKQPGIERERTRNEIVDAAKDVFLGEGRAVGLGSVAKAANVTRQTLYNLFGSKERLFRAVVNATYDRIIDPILHVDSKGDVRATLLAYGRQVMRVGLNPEVVALLRLTIAEVRDFPDLGRILYSTTSLQAPVLAAYFQAQIDAGRLRPFEPVIASEAFTGALTNHGRYRGLVGVGTETAEHREAKLRFTVDAFLYGVAVAPGEPSRRLQELNIDNEASS